MDPCEGTPNGLTCTYCRSDGCNGETFTDPTTMSPPAISSDEPTTNKPTTDNARLNSPQASFVVVSLAGILLL